MQLTTPGEWEETYHGLNEPGNYYRVIAELTDEAGDVKAAIWITMSGRDESWKVKVGRSPHADLREQRSVTRTRFDTEDEAKLKVIEFAREHPTLEDVSDYVGGL